MLGEPLPKFVNPSWRIQESPICFGIFMYLWPTYYTYQIHAGFYIIPGWIVNIVCVWMANLKAG